MTQRILIVSNSTWTIANFRIGLIRALTSAQYEVVAAGPLDESVSYIDQCVRDIEQAGARFVHMPLDANGTNPLKDLLYLVRLLRMMRRERPALAVLYTFKPAIYAGFAARLLGIPWFVVLTGLGTAFIRVGWLTRVVEALLGAALKGTSRVFVLNEEDRDVFVARKLVDPALTERLPGEGIDTDHFRPRPDGEDRDGRFRFLYIGRVLWDKGIKELVEAARTLRAAYPQAELLVLGFLEAANTTAIPREQMLAWEREQLIRYLGAAADVRDAIAQADCVVLPSYREGIPRSLLEAASMEKPVIATDVVGCRDVVEHGVTGYLCRPADATDLAAKMKEMLDLSPVRRKEMGRRGREKVLREYDERIVIRRYLDEVRKIALRGG